MRHLLALVACAPQQKPIGADAPILGKYATADLEKTAQALLAEGDRRNVVDRYRYWTREAIVADLDQRRHSYHVAVENWQHDFNIGTVVRNANAFLAAAGRGTDH